MAMDWTELMMAQGPSQKAQPTYDNLSENELKKVLQQEAMAGMQERQKGAEMQDFLAMQAAKQESPIDLSGGFEIVKALGGDKSAGSNYQAPKDNSADQLASAIKNKAAIQAQIQDDRTNMLKTLLEDKKSSREAGTQARWQARYDADQYKNLTKSIYDVESKHADFNEQMNQLKSALKPDQGNTISFGRLEGALAAYARAINKEKGALSDSDIGRVKLNTLKGKMEALQSFLSSNPKDVRVPVSQIQDMIDAVNDADIFSRQAAQEKLNQIELSAAEPTAPTSNMYYSKGGKILVEKTKKKYASDEPKKESSGNKSAVDIDAQIAAEEKRLQELGAMK